MVRNFGVVRDGVRDWVEGLSTSSASRVRAYWCANVGSRVSFRLLPSIFGRRRTERLGTLVRVHVRVGLLKIKKSKVARPIFFSINIGVLAVGGPSRLATIRLGRDHAGVGNPSDEVRRLAELVERRNDDGEHVACLVAHVAGEFKPAAGQEANRLDVERVEKSAPCHSQPVNAEAEELGIESARAT